ncbi:MAG TPA: allantoinase AllB [Candidatus Limnocylindria bacterium]|nr:allantoinase AllB [Candidatus Limnocylindria bacterium]
MADLAVRGGRVVLADRVAQVDILVLEGSILRIVTPGEGTADEEIDARGLVVLPGVVDAHVHVNEPGRTEWEGWVAATSGAAAGGVTTLADMPLNSIPPTIDEAAFDLKDASAAEGALVDYALWGGLVRADPAALRALADCGVVGVKCFLCPSGVDEFPHLGDDDLVAALRGAADAGLLVAAHCEDEATLARARAGVSGRDLSAWLRSRPAEAERIAIERLAAAAKRTGARVHVVHASSPEALAAVRSARRAGIDITAETCPHYLAFGVSDFALGPLLKCAPPIRDGARVALWDEVLAGRLEYVASDHSPCGAELKRRGDGDVFEAWGGISGIQSTLPLMLSEGVRERGMALEMLAQLLATRPAKRLGLWPRKGEIRPGTDADLVLVDPDREWTLTRDALHTRSGLSPYVGRRFTGAVVRTIVRGRTVYLDGEITATPGDGWFVRRMLA